MLRALKRQNELFKELNSLNAPSHQKLIRNIDQNLFLIEINFYMINQSQRRRIKNLNEFEKNKS
jgi:hypothetical protein